MAHDVVVVLNYKGRADTLRCVESLVTGSPTVDLLVVDNGSDDEVLSHVQRRWPVARTLQLHENHGFAGGMNAGIRWAMRAGADTVTVLNNDTLVPPGAVAALASRARSGCAVSPEVRYADGSERVWFGGGVVDPETNLAHHVQERRLPPPDADGLRATETLAGCCVTASMTTWRRVGVFDERYFLNFEDSDWSRRAADAGVPLVVDTRVHIHHRVSASFTGPYAFLGLYYYARNGLLFGRERCQGTWLEAGRFLRRQVLPDLRHHGCDPVEYLLRLVILVTALSHFARRRMGRAPRWLEVIAERRASHLRTRASRDGSNDLRSGAQ